MLQRVYRHYVSLPVQAGMHIDRLTERLTEASPHACCMPIGHAKHARRCPTRPSPVACCGAQMSRRLHRAEQATIPHLPVSTTPTLLLSPNPIPHLPLVPRPTLPHRTGICEHSCEHACRPLPPSLRCARPGPRPRAAPGMQPCRCGAWDSLAAICTPYLLWVWHASMACEHTMHILCMS